MFQHLDFLARPRSAVEKHGQREPDKKYEAVKHQHGVQIQRRINRTDIRKSQRTKQKDRGLLHQPLAKNKFRRGGAQATLRAWVTGAFGTAIKASRHDKQYKTCSRKLPPASRVGRGSARDSDLRAEQWSRPFQVPVRRVLRNSSPTEDVPHRAARENPHRPKEDLRLR